jgi:hypothetical protein
MNKTPMIIISIKRTVQQNVGNVNSNWFLRTQVEEIGKYPIARETRMGHGMSIVTFIYLAFSKATELIIDPNL